MITSEQLPHFSLSHFYTPEEYFPPVAMEHEPIVNPAMDAHLLGFYSNFSMSLTHSPLSYAILDGINVAWMKPDKHKTNATIDYRFIKRAVEYTSADPKNKRRARLTLSNSNPENSFIHLFEVKEVDDQGEIVVVDHYLAYSLVGNSHQTIGLCECIADWIKAGHLHFDIDEASRNLASSLN